MLRGRTFLGVILCVFLSNHIWGREIVLFSPDDQPERHLVSYLAKAHTKIYAAIYMLTSKEVVRSLVAAKERDIDVQIVLDSATLDRGSMLVERLKEAGVTVFIYHGRTNSGKNADRGIMHNKFIIIDNLLWTGSFNLTFSANSRNQENVLISDDKGTCESYARAFERLKERAGNPLRQRSRKQNKPSENSFWLASWQKVHRYVRKVLHGVARA